MSKPALDFVRSQSLLSQAKSDTTEAYVEDSEPEREVRRLQRKKTRVAKSRTPSQPVVIELTDSSPSPRSVAASLPKHSQRENEPIVIIDVSDGSGYSAPEDPREEYRSRKIVRKSSSRSSGELSIDTTQEESFPSIGKILGLPPKPASGNSKAPLKVTTSKAESRPVVPTPLSPVTASQESDTEDDDLLKLGRFAYPAVPRRTVSKTPSHSESELDIRPAAGKSKRAPAATAFTFATDFTDAELSQIRRCVSCEQGWTVRKTVAHKMKHIQTCAKKNKLTNETVRILLRKELDNAQPVASTSKLPAVSSPTTSETLLEDALKDAQKKKAGRRPQVLQTVKDVSETRDVILDRARSLLQNTHNTAHGGQSAEAQGSSCIPQTQAFRRSDVATSTVSETAANLDTTHVFGRSKLDAARASRVQDSVVRTGAAIAAYSDVSPLTQIFSASPVGEADNHSDEAPPSTQIFSRSKFSNMLGDSRRIVVNEDGIDEPISIHGTSEDEQAKSSPNRPTFRLITPSQSVNYPQPCASPTAHADDASHKAQSDRSPAPLGRLRSPSPAGDGVLHMDDYAADLEDFHVQDDYFYRWTEWNDDGPADAYMHYNPEDNASIASPSKTPAPTQDSPVPRRRRLNPISEDLPVAGPSRVLENDEPPTPEPPKKRTRKKKATSEGSDAEAAVGKDIAQEDLNARLQDAILKDETLHLRVLRYEPINFEVFMKLATDLGIPAKRSGLKNKVRTFLDQKAIHFYGADPSKSRTRRVRHP